MGLFDLKKRLLSNASLSDLHKIKTTARVVVVGAGAAGVSLASQLSHSGLGNFSCLVSYF